MDDLEKRQIMYNQMTKDPVALQGPATIKEGIPFEQGMHLTRDYIRLTMLAQHPDGFAARAPNAKKKHQSELVVLGPNDEWSGNGHDKLTSISFPIWGVRDVWSGRWLGLYVLPNNHLKVAVAYVWLKIVKEQGGIPMQMTTDCGSETGKIYGLTTALCEEFRPDLDISEYPAHKFLKSTSNITIEQGWLRLRLQWGENVKIFYDAGSMIYNPNDPKQSQLMDWLWSTLIQGELDHLRDRLNNHCIRKAKQKKNPLGARPNYAYVHPEEFGGQDGLLTLIDPSIIDLLMDNLGGEDLLHFVPRKYEEQACCVYSGLGVACLTMQNAWEVFSQMLPLM